MPFVVKRTEQQILTWAKASQVVLETGLRAAVELREDDASRTCAARWRILQRGYQVNAIHAPWSGPPEEPVRGIVYDANTGKVRIRDDQAAQALRTLASAITTGDPEIDR